MSYFPSSQNLTENELGENNAELRSVSEASKSQSKRDVIHHPYLGILEPCRGLVLESAADLGGDEITIPVLAVPDVVIFPGEDIPLRLDDVVHETIFSYVDHESIFSHVDHEPKLPVFGVVYSLAGSFRKVGTIVKVIYGRHNVIIARGLCRFILKHVRYQESDVYCVKIARDVEPPSINMAIKQSYVSMHSWPASTPFFAWKMHCPVQLALYAKKLIKESKSWKMLILDDKKSIRNEVEKFQPSAPQWNENLNPTEFSFWLAASLPINDHDRYCLLDMDSVVQRLTAEIFHLRLEDGFPLHCASCDFLIAHPEDMFKVGNADRVINAYVNIYGIVHQVITFKAAKNVIISSTPPSLDQTWFPGYAWTFAMCRVCLNQVGWMYLPTELVRMAGGQPFWGFRQNAIVHHKSHSDASDNETFIERWRRTSYTSPEWQGRIR